MRQGQHGYSANVRIQLIVDGKSLEIGQLYGDTIILREPIDHPPAPAELVLTIDGHEHRRAVELPEGLSRTIKTVHLQNR